MSNPTSARMTSDEFIAWAMEQPKGHRYELIAGWVVGMAPERSGHALAKGKVWPPDRSHREPVCSSTRGRCPWIRPGSMVTGQFPASA